METNNTSSFLKKSALSALVFFGTLIVLSVAYATYQTINSSEYAPGAPMTSSLMSKIAGNIDNLNTRLTSAEATIASQAATIYTLSASWAIMAFNLATCPTGWSAADGNGGRPDLRGRFIRGIDNGSGNDPDCASRTGWCAIGSTQADELKSHTHSLAGMTVANVATWGYGSLIQYGWATPIGATGGSETRPKNVAFLYCIKN